MHPSDRRAMSTRQAAARYTGWLGPLDYWHRNAPMPFNPAYDPGADARRSQITASMERDGYYTTHTREQCALEWRRRYDEDKQCAK